MAARIIAISGKSGCGNTTDSMLLAERLGFRKINYTFRDMALELGIPFNELLELAADDYSYDRLLDSRQIELARGGDCVIGSRLAIWLLPDAVLRVYLTASDQARADRIRSREGGDAEAVLAFTRERDKRDHDRYRRIYGLDNDDYSFADLVINTETFDPPAIIDIIVAALEKVGSDGNE